MNSLTLPRSHTQIHSLIFNRKLCSLIPNKDDNARFAHSYNKSEISCKSLQITKQLALLSLFVIFYYYPCQDVTFRQLHVNVRGQQPV